MQLLQRVVLAVVHVLEYKKKVSASFPRRYRISRREGFFHVLKKKPLMTDWFIFHRCERTSHPRLGISVGKRVAAKAVQRNLIKRIVRQHFRELAQDANTLDIVVRLRKNPNKSEISIMRVELQDTLRRLLQQK